MNEQIQPVDMKLFCPNCGTQHIDAPEPDNCQDCGHDYKWHFESDELPSGREGCGHPDCVCERFEAWNNPPHKSHRCGNCNTVWRPFDYPTNGVAAVEERAALKTQKWFCEKCGKAGSVEYEEHAGVGEVIYKIGDDHNEKSPCCTQPVCRLRIENESWKEEILK